MPKTLSTVQRKGFFITPIGEPSSEARYRSDTVLVHILEPALCTEFVDVIDRADLMSDPGEITPAIVNAIVDADLIIADLSDANPNVYYELAIAHAFAKPVIHIIEQGQMPRFDIKDVRTFPYGLHIDKALAATTSIAAAARAAATRGNQSTLVSRAADLKAAASSDNPVERQIADLRDLVLEIRYARTAPNPYAALLGPDSSPFPDTPPAIVRALTSEAAALRGALSLAERDALVEWVHEFVNRFRDLIISTIPNWELELTSLRLADALHVHAKIGSLSLETLRETADEALGVYPRLGANALSIKLPRLGGR